MVDWGGGAKGAAGGAAAGAAIGGPYGAVIGGAIGGLGGLFGGGGGGGGGSTGSDPNAIAGQNSNLSDFQRKQLMAYQQSIQDRQAPQLANLGLASASGFRANQQDLIDRLQQQAAGQGPSVSQLQLQQATDRNMAQQQSMAQSGRGNATLANIIAANNGNNFGQAAAQQAAQGRIQEQLNAQNALGSNIAWGRTADEQNSMFNSQQLNNANQTNLEAKLRTMGLNDQAIANVLGNQVATNAQMTQLAIAPRAGQGAPSLGDQILAGGSGLAGLYYSQQGRGQQAAPDYTKQYQQYQQDTGPITSPSQV